MVLSTYHLPKLRSCREVAIYQQLCHGAVVNRIPRGREGGRKFWKSNRKFKIIHIPIKSWCTRKRGAVHTSPRSSLCAMSSLPLLLFNLTYLKVNKKNPKTTASSCLLLCLSAFAGLLGVFKLCENPGSWWCQTGWVIWRLAAWEGFIESSLAYIRQFNLSFCVTQVVGSELFRGRRIYSFLRGILSSYQSSFIPGTWVKCVRCKRLYIRQKPKMQDWFWRISAKKWLELKLGGQLGSPCLAGLAEQPGKW